MKKPATAKAEKRRNFTLRLDERQLQWLQREAAKKGVSMSKIVEQMMIDLMDEDKTWKDDLRALLEME